MKISTTLPILIAVVTLIFGVSTSVHAQDSSSQTPSLGDVARKSRKDHASASHVPAKHVVNEEEDGPDPGGVWRLHACTYTPCFVVAITLPKTLKWTRPAAQPRPALIALKGPEEDANHVIRIYAADALPGTYYAGLYYQEAARGAILQGLFARPEYFGQAARIVLDEHIQFGAYSAIVTHFTVSKNDVKYRGLSIVSTATAGSLGFACVYREEDSKEAASICEGIIKSARVEAQVPQVRPQYPQDPPEYDPPDDPRDPTDRDRRVDDPQDDSPEN